MAGEKPAARLTDMHVCPGTTGPVPHVGGPILGACAATVLIGKLPAARVTDMAICVGPPDTIVMGSATVLIGGLPAARMGDQCSHGGVIALGCATVLIGDSFIRTPRPVPDALGASSSDSRQFDATCGLVAQHDCYSLLCRDHVTAFTVSR